MRNKKKKKIEMDRQTVAIIFCQIIQLSISAESRLLISSDMNVSRTDTGLGCSGFSLMLSRVIKFSPIKLLDRSLDCTTVGDFS